MPAGPLRTRYARIFCFETASAPRRLFFILFFYPSLPLHLLSFPACLVTEPRFVSFSHPAAIQCLMLWMRLARRTDWLLTLRNQANACESSARVRWRNVLCTCYHSKCLCRRRLTRLFIADDDALILYNCCQKLEMIFFF